LFDLCVFAELLSSVRRAHLVDDPTKLSKIYGFAEWSFRHPNKQLWNAAGVSFYEHAFDDRADIDGVMQWISPKTRAGVSALWEQRFQPSTFAEIRRASLSVRWSHQSECDAAMESALARLKTQAAHKRPV
jgi:hypothetical protein